MDNEWPSVKLDYNPWNHSRAENHGIVLGIFEAMHVMAVLELAPTDILEFNLDIESLYNSVPYHSFNHAIDVVVKLYYVLSDLQAASYLASYDIASLLISGLCHDCGHVSIGRNIRLIYYCCWDFVSYCMQRSATSAESSNARAAIFDSSAKHIRSFLVFVHPIPSHSIR